VEIWLHVIWTWEAEAGGALMFSTCHADRHGVLVTVLHKTNP
jgi:hypothetical protein